MSKWGPPPNPPPSSKPQITSPESSSLSKLPNPTPYLFNLPTSTSSLSQLYRPASETNLSREVLPRYGFRDYTSLRIPNYTSSNVSHSPLQARTTNKMGLQYNIYLNAERIFGCKSCKTHLATHDAIISRHFRGQHGKAYLFTSVVNILLDEPSDRSMTTGRHIVRDIHCRSCKETVGWKYDKAFEPGEKYKEGKFILEAELLTPVS